jgi:hypothetical protein
MAKKAKAKKSTTKESKVVRASLSELARLFTVIAQKPTATDDFMMAADKRKVFIKLDDSTKTFIRRFLSTNKMLKKTTGAPAAGAAMTATEMAVTAAPKDRFKCF